MILLACSMRWTWMLNTNTQQARGKQPHCKTTTAWCIQEAHLQLALRFEEVGDLGGKCVQLLGHKSGAVIGCGGNVTSCEGAHLSSQAGL